MLCKLHRIVGAVDKQLWVDNDKKVLVYAKKDMLFVCNLHPENAYKGYPIPTEAPGKHTVVMSTDDSRYGGFDRVAHQTYFATEKGFQIYLPPRTATVLKTQKIPHLRHPERSIENAKSKDLLA